MTVHRSLWDHQLESWNKARGLFAKGFRCILIQGVTGTGKTRMVGAMVNSVISKEAPGQDDIPESKRRKQTAWFVVPRKELLWQASSEFSEWKIQHGMIGGGQKESTAFQVHVCSRDTLIRRVRENAIRKWPDVIFFDEAHIAIGQQLEIKAAAPDNAIIIGVTATPERLDGKPLLGMYDAAVMGEQMQWFVERNYLKRPWVMSVPSSDRLAGMAELKTSGQNGDVNAKALMELYKERAKGNKIMFGNEIDHYKKHGKGRSFLIFCRNLKQAKMIADEFSEAGINTEPIDGTMTDKVRKKKIKAVESGKLIGLTTVDLCTYGLDVPKISCLILLRLTDSVSLFFQMIGRGLRWDGTNKECLILDHVGNCDEKKHGHPLAARVWNFEGREKKEKIPKDAIEKVSAMGKCSVCYGRIIDGICEFCGKEKEINSSKPMKQVDGWLVEIKEPTPLAERPPENRRHYADMINNNVDAFRAAWYPSDDGPGGAIDSKAVASLLEAAHDLKRRVLWVYHACLTDGDKMVNVALLAEIGRVKGYKPYWAVREREKLQSKFYKAG